MKPGLILMTMGLSALLLSGCQATVQNDNLGHALYESPAHQSLVKFNDAHDVHALADASWVRDWVWLMDEIGADGYYELHLWLNAPAAD